MWSYNYFLRTLGVIQARMGSTRFPKKMMKLLGNYTLIDWVLRRCKQASEVDRWILATSDRLENDCLEQKANELGIECYRGSEEDVLSRFIFLFNKYLPERIIRVCADNPLVEPKEIDRLVTFFKSSTYDYAFNHIPKLGNNYIDGLGAEIFSSATLITMKENVVLPSHKEHATLYIWDNQKDFSIGTFRAPDKYAYPQIRFDVDREENLKELENLIDSKVLPENFQVEHAILKRLKL